MLRKAKFYFIFRKEFQKLVLGRTVCVVTGAVEKHHDFSTTKVCGEVGCVWMSFFLVFVKKSLVFHGSPKLFNSCWVGFPSWSKGWDLSSHAYASWVRTPPLPFSFRTVSEEKKLDELGIDPNTSRMLSGRSTIWATRPWKQGLRSTLETQRQRGKQATTRIELATPSLRDWCTATVLSGLNVDYLKGVLPLFVQAEKYLRRDSNPQSLA